jgi:2-desacetyl-2-hydroxyethyl bacteriochlorophyllide A dehydrogenase
LLAAQLISPRKIELTEIDMPICDHNLVLIKVRYTAICGTDMHTYRNANVNLPRTMGHETTGIVWDKGKNVTSVEIGDRVVVNPIYSCGQCQLCQEGKEYLCHRGGLRGRESDGYFAEYIVASESDVFKIPEGLQLAAATQIQTLSTVYHAQKRLQIEPGKSVMVVGMGISGFLHLQLAKVSGAIPVIAVINSKWKADLAQKLGADEVISIQDGNTEEKIKNVTGSLGPYIVIEATGIPSMVALSTESIASGGKVLLFGTGSQPLTGVNPYSLYFKEVNLINSRAASRTDWQPAINLVGSGVINLQPLVTHLIPLHEIQKAFNMVDERIEKFIRVAVEMPEGDSH